MKSGKLFHLHGKDATVAWDVVHSVGTRAGVPWIWHRTPGFGDTIDFDDLRHAEERDVEEPVADVGLPEDRL